MSSSFLRLTNPPRVFRVNWFRKGADGLWVLHPSGRGEPVTLASVELTVPAAALWDEVPEDDDGSAPAQKV